MFERFNLILPCILLKKKLSAFAIMMALALFSLYAEKSYDNGYGYRGAASASYLGMIDEIDVHEKVVWMEQVIRERFKYNILGSVKKLTKEQSWLIVQALCEYDFQQGEVYYVYIIPSSFPSSEALWFVTVIEEDGYCWYGGLHTKK